MRLQFVTITVNCSAALAGFSFAAQFTLFKSAMALSTGLTTMVKSHLREATQSLFATKSGKIFGTMAHGRAISTSVKLVMLDEVTRHFNGELRTDEVIVEMQRGVAAAR
jgi:glucose/mannose transport system substrate-binding protein